MGMKKREEILMALERCLRGNDVSHCEKCPYDAIDFRCRVNLRDDVFSLLKAQDPVYPERSGKGTYWYYCCGNCGQPLDPGDPFCRKCGRAVKWDD